MSTTPRTDAGRMVCYPPGSEPRMHYYVGLEGPLLTRAEKAEAELAAAREALIYWNWAVNHPNEFAEIINDHIKWGPDKQKNDAMLYAAIDAAKEAK